MGIFDSTPVTESPETGHEEVAAEETQDTQEPTEEETVEAAEDAGPNEEEEPEETPSEQEHGETEGKEELLAGKYKTVDELVKGYKNLLREYTKTKQEQKQMQSQTQLQVPAQQPYNQDYNEIFRQYFEQDPIGTLQFMLKDIVQGAVQQHIAPIQENREIEVLTHNIEALSKEYAQVMTEQGLNQLFNQVAEIAEELGNPNLSRNPTKRVLRMAAEELWGGPSKALMYQRGKEEARKEMENTLKQKKVISTKTTKKPEIKKTEEDLIREAILKAGGGGGIFN